MVYKQRLLAQKLHRLIARFPVVVVSGARQVGKTTLLTRELPTWQIVTFDPVLDVANARQDPELFLNNHPPPLILDEIQYAPELVAAIKRRVDAAARSAPAKSSPQYILTGSQQWSVLRTAGESLAGRAVFLDLEAMALCEIAGDAGTPSWLERYLDDPERFLASQPRRLKPVRTLFDQLWRGFLPAADALEPSFIGDFHRAYLRTYIERDARVLADVADWQTFGRFVQLAAALTAQEINHSQLCRELGITAQTAQRWLAVLRGTFQWFETPPWYDNAIKRIATTPKGYLADTGMACALQFISSPEGIGGNRMAGALFETAVAAEIRKLCGAMAAAPAIFHWRSYSGPEVDLLLQRDGRFYPIEIKLASQPGRAHAAGIAAFRSRYPNLKIMPGLVVAPTERCMQISEEDYALPWDCQ